MFNPFADPLFGMKVHVMPDVPKYKFTYTPCRLADGTEFDWLTPEARRDLQRWLLEFFGTTNPLDGKVIFSAMHNFAVVEPRHMAMLINVAT